MIITKNEAIELASKCDFTEVVEKEGEFFVQYKLDEHPECQILDCIKWKLENFPKTRAGIADARAYLSAVRESKFWTPRADDILSDVMTWLERAISHAEKEVNIL